MPINRTPKRWIKESLLCVKGGGTAKAVTEGLLKNYNFSLADIQYNPSDAKKLAFLREEGGPRKWWKERAQLKIFHKLKIEELKLAHIEVHTYLKLTQTVK